MAISPAPPSFRISSVTAVEWDTELQYPKCHTIRVSRHSSTTTLGMIGPLRVGPYVLTSQFHSAGNKEDSYQHNKCIVRHQFGGQFSEGRRSGSVQNGHERQKKNTKAFAGKRRRTIVRMHQSIHKYERRCHNQRVRRSEKQKRVTRAVLRKPNKQAQMGDRVHVNGSRRISKLQESWIGIR